MKEALFLEREIFRKKLLAVSTVGKPNKIFAFVCLLLLGIYGAARQLETVSVDVWLVFLLSGIAFFSLFQAHSLKIKGLLEALDMLDKQQASSREKKDEEPS